MMFSILIPAYKKEYLEEAILSVCNQIFDDWELIVLNDNSPYDLDAIFSHFTDRRIFFLKNEKNVGAIDVVNNWNRCLDYCTGDYVICMGDDDILDPQCLSVYADYIQNYPNTGVFHTRAIIINEKGEKEYITDARPERESMYALIQHRMKEEQFIGDFCFKRKELLKLGGFYYLPLAWGSDDMTAFLCARSEGVVNVQTPVFYYRKSSLSITNGGKVELKIQALNKLKECYSFLMECVPDNDIEKLERKAILSNKDKYFFRRKAEDISIDIRTNLVHFVRWLFKRKKYNVSFGCLCYALCLAVGRKYKR